MITLITLRWFLPSIHWQMCFKITISVKSPITITAMIWSFPVVYHHMRLQISTSVERYITIAALIYFPCYALSYIYFQITICTLWIIILVAVIWPLISMYQKRMFHNAAFNVNFITLATMILLFSRMNYCTTIEGLILWDRYIWDTAKYWLLF